MAVGGDGGGGGGGGGGGDDDEHTVSAIKILSHHTLAYRLTRSLTDWPLVTSSSSSPADICKTIYNFNVFCTPVRDRIYICRSNNNRNQLANANEKKKKRMASKKTYKSKFACVKLSFPIINWDPKSVGDNCVDLNCH